MFISYAQNCEDIVLWRVLGHVENGTYIDVGAADPTEFSVTKAFYDRGWSGVNVEPAPEFVERLEADRERDATFAVCAGEKVGPITLHYVPGTGLSTVTDDHLPAIEAKKFEVRDIVTEVKRLDDLLDSAGLAGRDIHFLKVDVEGAEETVLRSIDLTRWRPWVIVVEATEAMTTLQNHASWEPIVLGADYSFCLFDGLNRFYVANERPELAPVLSYPAGVFDQPYTVGTGQNELAARTEALIVERDELAASYARLEAEHALGLEGYEKLSTEYRSSLESYETLHERFIDALTSYDSLKHQLDATIAGYEKLHEDYNRSLMAYHDLESSLQATVDGYERLQGAYDKALDAYATLETEHRETLQGYGRLESEYKGALDGYNRLHQWYEDLLTAHERVNTEHAETLSLLDTSHGDLDRTRANLVELQARFDVAAARLARIEGSWPWKVAHRLHRPRRR